MLEKQSASQAGSDSNANASIAKPVHVATNQPTQPAATLEASFRQNVSDDLNIFLFYKTTTLWF